jgi:hypothetical protein
MTRERSQIAEGLFSQQALPPPLRRNILNRFVAAFERAIIASPRHLR